MSETGMQRNLRRWIVQAVMCWIAFCFALHGGRNCVYAGEAPEQEDSAGTQSTDFVLVLDCSDSMEQSDPQSVYLSAARMFIDMLPAENARLSIIAFGPDYGEEAWQGKQFVEEADSFRNRLVRVFYDLQSVTDQNSKRGAKQAVTAAADATAGTQGLTYTPIGYALEAAMSVLEEGGAGEGDAAVILLSDGRVSGQLDGYNDALDYESIDAASDEAASHGWPIYCLELNEDAVNDSDNWRGKIGRHEMRTNIPERTDTAPITLRSPDAAQEAFTDIFARFFEADSTMTVDSRVIEEGKAAMNFDVGDLVTETNITLTGEIASVEKIGLVTPDGTAEEYLRADGDVDEPERKVVFENRYIITKLMLPKSGTWEIAAYGTDGVQVGLYAVSIRELTLTLADDLPARIDREEGESDAEGSGAAGQAADAEDSGAAGQTADAEGSGAAGQAADAGDPGIRQISAGHEVTFTAAFTYRGAPYTSEIVYQRIPAVLRIEKDQEEAAVLDMTARTGEYQASYTFPEPGIYTVMASAQSGDFRQGLRDSALLTYEVSEGSLSDEQTPAGAETEAETETESEVPDVPEPSSLMFTPLAGAAPDAPDATIEQSLTIKKLGPPDFLLDLAGVGTVENIVIRYADYFTDPDNPELEGVSFVCTDVSGGTEGLEIQEMDEAHVVIRASKAAKGSFQITAADTEAGPEVIKTLVVNVTSTLAWKPLIQRYWWAGIIAVAGVVVLLVLLITMIRRRMD